jgi:large-conductance mechanosensitive channel
MRRKDTDENRPMKKNSVETDFGKVLNALMGFIIIGFSVFARGIKDFGAVRQRDAG